MLVLVLVLVLVPGTVPGTIPGAVPGPGRARGWSWPGWCRCSPWTNPVPAHPVVPAGLAGTLALVQALGDAGVGARLWVLTRGAVAAGAG